MKNKLLDCNAGGRSKVLLPLVLTILLAGGVKLISDGCGYKAGPRCSYNFIPCTVNGHECSKWCIDDSNYGWDDCVAGGSEDMCSNVSGPVTMTSSFGTCSDGTCNYTDVYNGNLEGPISLNGAGCGY